MDFAGGSTKEKDHFLTSWTWNHPILSCPAPFSFPPQMLMITSWTPVVLVTTASAFWWTWHLQFHEKVSMYSHSISASGVLNCYTFTWKSKRKPNARWMDLSSVYLREFSHYFAIPHGQYFTVVINFFENCTISELVTVSLEEIPTSTKKQNSYSIGLF